VGAYCSRASFHGMFLRNIKSEFPIKPFDSSGPNAILNPKINHIILKKPRPKKICMKTETAFFFRKRPDSNNASAGIIKNTRAPARIIQVVSPVSSGNDVFLL